MTLRKRKKKQRREEEKQVLPGIELGTSCTRYHYDTMQLETHCEDVDNILLTAFHFRQRTLYKVDRAPLNTNSATLFRRMSAVLTVKT